MVRCVRAESVREQCLELLPASRKVRIGVAMRRIRDVIGLAKVYGIRIVLAISRVVAQRFHADFVALFDHDVIEVTTCCVRPHQLEPVQASILEIFSPQNPFEWQGRLIGWRKRA